MQVRYIDESDLLFYDSAYEMRQFQFEFSLVAECDLSLGRGHVVDFFKSPVISSYLIGLGRMRANESE